MDKYPGQVVAMVDQPLRIPSGVQILL